MKHGYYREDKKLDKRITTELFQKHRQLTNNWSKMHKLPMSRKGSL